MFFGKREPGLGNLWICSFMADGNHLLGAVVYLHQLLLLMKKHWNRICGKVWNVKVHNSSSWLSEAKTVFIKKKQNFLFSLFCWHLLIVRFTACLGLNSISWKNKDESFFCNFLNKIKFCRKKPKIFSANVGSVWNFPRVTPGNVCTSFHGSQPF